MVSICNRARAALSALAFVLAVAALTWALAGCAGNIDVETAPGQPLEAVRYEPPLDGAWTRQYRVLDRATGEQWWLLRTRDPYTWVVLPIRETQEVGDDA